MKQTRDWENQYITAEKSLSDATPYGAYETGRAALAGKADASSLCNGSERRLEIQNLSVTGSGGSIL